MAFSIGCSLDPSIILVLQRSRPVSTRIAGAPSNELEDLVNEDHRESNSQNQEPLVEAKGYDSKHLSKEWHIEDDKVQAE